MSNAHRKLDVDESTPTTPPAPARSDLPDGWVHVGSAGPYYKIARRDAVTVPRAADPDDGISRDSTVIVEPDGVGVVRGPGMSRQRWTSDQPDQLALALVEVLDEWVDDGRDVYGGEELTERLNAAAANL